MKSFNIIVVSVIWLIVTISRRSYTMDLPDSISTNNYCDMSKESNRSGIFLRSRKCFKNRSNRSSADHSQSNYENRILRTIATGLLNVNGPFDPSISALASTTCKLDTKLYMDALKSLDLWAFRMYDASAKMPTGLLNGNVNQFGDFDQCLSVKHSSGIRGQYCLAYIQIRKPEQQYERLSELHKFVHSHYIFVSDIDDPGHRVPRFSAINWALCVPSSCSVDAIEGSFKQYVRNYTAGLPFKIDIRVNKEMCYVQETPGYDRNTKLAASLFLLVIVIALISTLLDYKIKTLNPWLRAFSLYTNIPNLFSVVPNSTDIQTIHGIRFLNAFLLLISHKSMALFFDPQANRTGMAEYMGQSWTGIGRIAAVYTDVFLLLSGLLTSYTIYGRLQRGQSPRLFSEYVGRFLRIVPTFGALILFCTYILPNLGTGPQWNLVVAQHADKCKKYWWRNLLFIHNYFGFEEMCLTHTHHLGIDTQLFILAPLQVFLLWKWPKKGIILLLAIAGLATIGRFQVTFIHNLSNYVYYGTSIKSLFKTADYMYSIPIYRSTIYILGVLLGYVLRIGKKWTLTPLQRNIGWTISTTLFLLLLLCPLEMNTIDYKYNVYHAAIYAALSPIGWCGIFAWTIFSSYLGYENIITHILSWKGFLITTRLSYAIYLTQFPTFFYNVGRVRYPGHYVFLPSTINHWENCFIVLSAIVLTLLFDMPFQNIKKILFRDKGSAKAVVEIKPINDCKND